MKLNPSLLLAISPANVCPLTFNSMAVNLSTCFETVTDFSIRFYIHIMGFLKKYKAIQNKKVVY